MYPTTGRHSKEDGAFEAMGTIDELSSFLGVAHAKWEREIQEQQSDNNHELKSMTRSRPLQEGCWISNLVCFVIGSHVAKPRRHRCRKSTRKKSDNNSSSSSSSGEDEDEEPIPFVADGGGGGFDAMHIDG